MKRAKILVVDDDAFFRTLCADILTTAEYDVITAATGNEAIRIVESEPIDIVITDLIMPDTNGLEVLHRTKLHNTLIDVIVITGYGSIETAIEALKSGAVDYVRKPLNGIEILHTVASCLGKKALLEENIDMKLSLRLYEVTRTIASTIDINQLYQTSIDALLQMVDADAGLAVFYEGGATNLEIKAAKHIALDTAERLVELIKTKYEKELQAQKNVNVIPASNLRDAGQQGCPDDMNSILIAPLVRGDSTTGFLMLFDKGSNGFVARDAQNSAFIANHVSQAYDNARRYSDAKETAFIDSLTNLYNSKYLDIVLEKEMKRSDRLLMPLTVLFIDIDKFKQINDYNDHIVGSKVLVEFGKVLLKFVRDVDTVIRYGGDEYVIILVDADYDVAFKVAERIRQGIEHTPFLAEEGLDIRLTASIGVATYPIHARDKKELLKIADRAMYSAKDISRNVVYLAPLPEGAGIRTVQRP